MTDCSKIPTLTLVESSKNAMEDVVDFAGSSSFTYVSELDGKTKTTIKGALNKLGGNNKGNYLSDPVLEDDIDYTYFAGTQVKYKVAEGVVTPYQVDSATYPDPETDPNLTVFDYVTNSQLVSTIKTATGIFSLKDLIGVSNGDDITEEIKAINANEAITTVFIPSGVSFTSNVGLQKDSYGDGTLTYRMNNIGGRENSLSRSVSEGVAAMKRCEDFGLTPTQKCAFTKVAGRYFAYRHLGGSLWLEMQYLDGGLDGSGRPTRWNWYDTYVRQYSATSVAGDSNVTTAGTFTDINSTDSTPYVGHRTTRSQVIGGSIDVEVTSGGDYYVVVVGQIYGNYMKVEIDGSYDLVNELPDDIGYPYVDCYSATEPDYRKRVLVATNVPPGSHTITLTHMSDSNASKDPLLDRMWWNAVEISSEESSVPWSDSVRPKQWSDGVLFSAYDECIGPNGNFYVTSSGGTSGSTPPTHTSGTVSDGGVSWLSIASSAFEQKSTRLQPTPAQVDYAYEVTPDGQADPQDVGGNAHGNEYLTSDPELYADGVMTTLPSAGEFVIARSIVFRQNIRAYYTLTSSEIDLNDTVLNYEIDKDGKTISHTMNWLYSSSIGYFYPAMWTLYRYTGGNDKYNIFDTCYRPIGDDLTLQDYIGLSNPIVGGTRDVYAELRGRVFRSKNSGNISSDNGELSVRAGLLVTSASVNNYKNTEFSFGMATNNSSFDGTNDSEGWTVKMYFQRCSTVDYAKEQVEVGDSWNSESRYCVSVG